MFFTMSDEARLKAFKWGFVTVLAVWALLLMSDPAHAAATGGAEFKSLYELVSGWARGYLGRAIAAVFLLVGLLTGLVRGSAVTAMGAAVALLMLPAIIDTLFNGVGV